MVDIYNPFCENVSVKIKWGIMAISIITMPISVVHGESSVFSIQPVQETHFSGQGYQGTYGLEGFGEVTARFVEGIFLSVQALEDGLYVVNECENQVCKIAFERYTAEGDLAIFSHGYAFELNTNKQPVAVRHGNIRWVLWGH